MFIQLIMKSFVEALFWSTNCENSYLTNPGYSYNCSLFFKQRNKLSRVWEPGIWCFQ
jgi:hypothetical protein